MKLEHIGIAVKDLEKSNKLFAAIFNQQPYKMEAVESGSATLADLLRSGM